MKPFFCLSLACLACAVGTLRAQNSASELALERKANEERFNMLNARVTSLLETQELLRESLNRLEKRLDSLGREIDRMKEENARSGTRVVTREELKTLYEKIQEIDRNREADKKLILDNITALAKVPLSAPTPNKPPVERAEKGETYTYTVQENDRLLAIIAGYNAEFDKQGLRRITLEQVKKANPDLNPDKIRKGQIIEIPIPQKK